MEVLADLPVPVCCVSNADTSDICSAIELHRLRFDGIVTSEDARCYKPEVGIFQKAMHLMKVAADEVLHVGDSLHSDVGGAQRCGIEAVWVCRDRRIHDIGTIDANHKISSLTDLRRFFA